MTSSYVDSMCVSLPVLLACCTSRAVFVLCLFRMVAIAMKEATTLIMKAVARELVDIMKAVFEAKLCMLRFSIGCTVLVFTPIGPLALPVIFPQTTVCMAKVHTVPSVGTSVQVTVVWSVVVGQLPQFNARML